MPSGSSAPPIGSASTYTAARSDGRLPLASSASMRRTRTSSTRRVPSATSEAVARSIRAAGGQAQAHFLDMADAVAIPRVVDPVADRGGALDVLVSNAGISVECSSTDPDHDSSWLRGIDVLLPSQQRLVRAALPWLRRSNAPRIVTISSVEALGATAGTVPIRPPRPV